MKKTILLLVFSTVWTLCHAQYLDRISMSCGGAATNEVNYVIGETFNFTMASDADIVIETGSLGSEGNTGGDANFTEIVELAAITTMKCSPNPVSDILQLQTGLTDGARIDLVVYNENGQIVYQKAIINQTELSIDFKNMATGMYYISVVENESKTIKAIKIIKQ